MNQPVKRQKPYGHRPGPGSGPPESDGQGCVKTGIDGQVQSVKERRWFIRRVESQVEGNSYIYKDLEKEPVRYKAYDAPRAVSRSQYLVPGFRQCLSVFEVRSLMFEV